MPITPLPGVYNQVHYPGAGDVDDCAVVTSLWCIVAAGVLPKAKLPTIREFRVAAGVPDAPGPTGMGNAQVLKAIRKLVPQAASFSFDGYYSDLKRHLSAGAVISLMERNSLLPSSVRFSFAGIHQIGVVYVGGVLRVMNPLAPEGSGVLSISESNLRRAAEGLSNDGKFHGVIIPMAVPPIDPKDAKIASLEAELGTLRITYTSAMARIAEAKRILG
jgi:hypothetical protein